MGLVVGVVAGYGVGFITYQPQISRLQSDLSETQSSLSETQSALSTSQSEVESLRGQLTEAQASIASLETDLTEAQDTITSLETQLTELLSTFSMQVIPAHIEDAVAGQRCVFLVVVEEPEWAKGPAVSISAIPLIIPFHASVTVEPQAITPGQVAEVTVIPDEASINSTLAVTVFGERGGLKKAEKVTVRVSEGEDGLGPFAAEVRDRFIPWLATNHPEFGITSETKWSETVVRPHFLVVMYYLFFSEDWEMGLSWHVTIPPYN